MNITSAFQEYRDAYLPARNYALKTRQYYAQDVQEFIRYLDQQNITLLSGIQTIRLMQYLASLDTRGLAGSTRRRKTFALKSFFYFLEIQHYLVHNPCNQLQVPQSEERLPRVLMEDEYKRLQAVVRGSKRDAAIIELFLQTGIRLSELANITLTDLTLPTVISHNPHRVGVLIIRQGKGGKDRAISLNYKVCFLLQIYLRERYVAHPMHLFLSERGLPLTQRGYEWILSKYFRLAQIQDASVHTLRHTFGTHMIKNGSNLRTVQEMMGHSNIKTTSRYISLVRNQMDKDVQAYAL